MIVLLLTADGNIRRAEIHSDRKEHEAHGGLSSTILGGIIIHGDRLTAEVNAAKRTKSIRRKIEARLGAGARFKVEEIGTLEGMMRDEALMGCVMASSSEHEALMQASEVRRHMADTIRAHWGAWVDRDLPALGGRTPREVVGVEVLPARVRVLVFSQHLPLHLKGVSLFAGLNSIAAPVKDCEDASLVSDTAVRFGEGRSMHGEGCPKKLPFF